MDTETSNTNTEVQEPVVTPEVTPDNTSTETPEASHEDVSHEEKKKKTLDERVAELKRQTWEAREAQRQVEKREQELLERERKIQEFEEKSIREPNPDDFDNIDSYRANVKQYADKKAEIMAKKMANEHLQQQAMINRQNQTLATWKFKKEQALKESPEFANHERTVEYALRSFNTHPAIEQELIRSEASTKIVSYLANNPDKLEKLATSDPGEALKQLGILEYTLGTVERKSQNAPAPSPDIPGGGSPTTDLSRMSFADFARKRNELERNRR